MVKGDSCETDYEIKLKQKQQAELNKPIRPITTEAEEAEKERQKQKMKMAANSQIEIDEIKKKEVKIVPKPDEIAPDNPQKRELEQVLKEEKEKESFKFCPHCGKELPNQEK